MTWNINNFLTPELLGTFGGVVMVVTLLTQATKRYVSALDPKWIALVWAVVASVVKQVATGELGFVSLTLAGLNAVVIAGASVGAFEGARSARRFFEGEDDSV